MTRKAAPDPNTPGETQSFETMMDRLQDLVGRLEQGNLTLEDSIRSFEEGMDLVRRCTEVLNQAEERIRKLNPPADFVIDYGDRDEHCWNGDHTRANAYSRLRYVQMTFPWFVERALAGAPPGADVRSWRY